MASGDKSIPVEQCWFIQDFTGDQVTCEEMRPDKTRYFEKVRELAGRALARAQAATNAAAVTAAAMHPG